MKSMKSLVGQLPDNRRKLEEIKRQALQDKDIIKIKEQYPEIATDEWLNDSRNISTLRCHIQTRDTDPYYTSRLSIYHGMLHQTSYARTKALEKRFENKQYSKAIYDNNTSAFRDVKLADVKADFGNSAALAWIIEFTEKYHYGRSLNGAWVSGNFGVGKSYLMGALVTALRYQGASIMFVAADRLITRLQELMRYNSNELEKELWKLRKTEILILDDIGTEVMTNWSIKRVLYDILQYRYSNNLTTFFTSNYTKKEYCNRISQELGQIEGQRFLSRLDSMAVELSITGADKREKAV